MITIVKGKDKEIFINVVSKETGRPKDLTQLVTAQIKFRNEDDSILTLSYPSGGITKLSDGGGRLKAVLETTQTALFAETEVKTLELEYELGVAAANDPANYKDTIFIEEAYRVVSSEYAL